MLLYELLFLLFISRLKHIQNPSNSHLFLLLIVEEVAHNPVLALPHSSDDREMIGSGHCDSPGIDFGFTFF